MLSRQHDPARWSRRLGTAAALLLFIGCARFTEFDLATLANPQTLSVLGHFAAGFWPPAHDTAFLRSLGAETVTTVAIASCGMVLAVAIGAPVAFFTSRALDTQRLGHDPANPAVQGSKAGLRALMVLFRGVPEIVWALLFVRAAGLGTLPAVLAIGLSYGGMLGKVYAEILEAQPAEPARALAALGAGRLARLAWGAWPQALPELVSYTVYRWECAIRASAVMGFVGAGGIGQMLDTSIKMLNGGEVGMLILVFLLLVSTTEAISAQVRRQLERRHGGKLTALLALAGALGCLAWLWPGWRAAGFDLAGVGRFALSFLPPDWSVPLWQGTLQTLAISALSTALAFAGAALLALPAASRHAGAKTPARMLLNILRGIPDLLWASLAVLAVGLGPAAGVLALALHTTGVLGRLFAETLENVQPEPTQALRALGAGRLGIFCYGVLPQVLVQWLAYALYRWENNIRIAAVLGIVGAGGLGQQLYLALSLFQQQAAATLIAVMLLLSWIVEQLSRALRRRLESGSSKFARLNSEGVLQSIKG